ncbi:MAG: hypothetical protein JO338_07720 [Aquitalea sp.]|nr:hypothetical protein [Aquitalea sp.]
MDILHSTWFWLFVIVALVMSTIGSLARLSKAPPPVDLPGVKSQPYADDDEDEDSPDSPAGHTPASLRKPK